ncbi:MAG: MupG family TIM beta-alpha barrel fold protein [Longicatena sp.]
MHKLGLSIYPEHSTREKDFAYMELGAKYGFTRIFTCLLSVAQDKDKIFDEFGTFMKKAHELGYEVAVDTNPEVFKVLGATPLDLKAFHELEVDIIRLDGHFDDFLDRAITHNQYGIKIEFNGSADTTIDFLLKHGADIHNMCVCHNFYPQRYSGISWDLFMMCNEKWKDLGLHTAAFVSSNEKNTFGPWPVSAGLPTVEIHRNLPIDLQARHMLACELIDDILIGNTFASEEELKALSQIDTTKTMMRLDLDENISETEKDILFNSPHCGRGDYSDFYVRSTLPRFTFGKESIPYRKHTDTKFHRGDVVIVNDNLKHYRAELEIVLQDIENDGERNYVGKLAEHEIIILDELELHQDHMFGFVK